MLYFAAAFFALATLADCVTTAIALKRGKTEGNPIARKLFGRHVVLGAALVSAAFLGFALWGGQYAPNSAQTVLWLVGAAHAVAAAFNARYI